MGEMVEWQGEGVAEADERRRDPRRPAPRAKGKLYAPGDQKHLFGLAVAMVDLSLHGAGFRSDEELVVGKRYGLEIHGDWMHLSSRVRVVSCRESGSGAFEVGVAFC